MAFITPAPSSTDSYSYFKTSYFFTKMQLLIIVTFNSFTFSFESVTFMSLKNQNTIKVNISITLHSCKNNILYSRVTGKEGSVQEGCGTGEMLDRRDTGQVGCRTGRMQEKEGCRKGERKKVGMQDRREAGNEGCSKGVIQDWKDTGPEGYIKGGISDLRDTGKEGSG